MFANDLRGNGFRVLDPMSAEVRDLVAGGSSFTVIVSPGTQGFATSWRYTVKQNTMLQVVMPITPASTTVPFALWVQDRTGDWKQIGTTSVVAGQIVMPVLLFDKPGVYQIVATSIDAVAGARAKSSEPQWGRTTVRTIVTVDAREALGSQLCPNMVGFNPESATLHRGDRAELRKLATCLGATPRIVITGHVHVVTNPTVAKRLAVDRAASVRSYLRDLGYTGRVVVQEAIMVRPPACEPVAGRCAIVEIRVDLGRSGNVVSTTGMATTESPPAVDAATPPTPSPSPPAPANPAVDTVPPFNDSAVAPAPEPPAPPLDAPHAVT